MTFDALPITDDARVWVLGKPINWSAWDAHCKAVLGRIPRRNESLNRRAWAALGFPFAAKSQEIRP